MRKRLRLPDQRIVTPISFEMMPGYFKVIIDTSAAKEKPDTIGLTFLSVEHFMEFVSELTERAAQTWPDHPLIKMYREEE